MKCYFNFFILSILMTVMFLSCSKKTENIHNADNYAITKSESNPINSLADLQKFGQGTLTEVPYGYQLKMEGLWDYDHAYIYTDIDDTIHEVYYFESENGRNEAAADCDMNYYEKDGKICCSGEGNGCSVVQTTTGFEIVVCPVV